MSTKLTTPEEIKHLALMTRNFLSGMHLMIDAAGIQKDSDSISNIIDDQVDNMDMIKERCDQLIDKS